MLVWRIADESLLDMLGHEPKRNAVMNESMLEPKNELAPSSKSIIMFRARH